MSDCRFTLTSEERESLRTGEPPRNPNFGPPVQTMRQRLERAVAERDAALNLADALVGMIERAREALGPGDDEDCDSPANMAFAILTHALTAHHEATRYRP